jgi:uncharacterized protein (DUF362 family)
MTRRALVPLAGTAALAGVAQMNRKRKTAPPRARSPVAVVKAASYNQDLAQRMIEGVRMCGLEVRGQCVLLKPNLVEFDRSTAINTDVAVVAAALEVFRSLGAAEVRIGEGPGHRRDTWDVAGLTGYRSRIPGFDSLFTDLNRDDVSEVKGFAGEASIFLPHTALRADLIVSLAKMKTHHWAGATLAMKNLFGLVPGSVYGWPKNKLHHVGIDRSVFELNRIFRRTFAIVDGIVGMEGNGPIQGTPKQCGVLVMGGDLPAVDATCCRIMGIDPAKIKYLEMARTLGNTGAGDIEQRGESVDAVRTNFELFGHFQALRLAQA